VALSYNQSMGMESIPNFLKARSAQGLRRLIRRNNLRLRSFVVYNIQWVESEKSWFAWYVEPSEKASNEDLDEQSG
jgi:hypothetical protein